MVSKGNVKKLSIRLTCVFAIAFFICTSALAFASKAQFDQADLQAYVAGETVNANYSPGSDQNTGDNAGVHHAKSPAADLQQKLNNLYQSLIAITGDSRGILGSVNTALDLSIEKITPLNSQIESVLAAHELYLYQFGLIRQRLTDYGAIADGEVLLQQQEKAYKDSTQDFIATLKELQSAINTKKDLGFFDYYALTGQLEKIEQLVAPASPTILRASMLPVRQSAQNAPVFNLGEHILPAYEQSELAAFTAQDLAEQGDVLFTASVRELAESLGHNPVSIYEYVKNTIHTEFYPGAMQGINSVVARKAGNSTDQSTLLIALLRASGIPARYVHGVVEYPVEQLQALLAVENTNQITGYLSKVGIAHQAVIKGGRVSAFLLDETWVAAQVPYANYRGALVDTTGKVWLGLMPHVKVVQHQPRNASLDSIEVTAAEYIQTYTSELGENSPLQAVTSNVQQALAHAGVLEDYTSLFAAQTVVTNNTQYLPNSLPIKVIGVKSESAQLDNAYRHWVNFTIYRGSQAGNDITLQQEIPLTQLDDKRVTVSYIAGSVASQNIINAFGGLGSVPAYLVDLRPQIKVNGIVKATGNKTIAMGRSHQLIVEAVGPSYREKISKDIIAGGYHAIAISAQSVFNFGDFEQSPQDTEYLAAKLLSQMALRYLQAWDKADEELASIGNLVLAKPVPSIVFVSNKSTVQTLLQQPQRLDWTGVTMDAALHVSAITPAANQHMMEADWRRLSALHGSYLEHRLFEQSFGVSSLSADKVLALHAEQNLPIYTIDASNVDQVLPQLTLSQPVLEEITQWVAQGYQVKTVAQATTFEAWTGAAWIVENLENGDAGYFLSGGLAGGSSMAFPSDWPQVLIDTLSAPYLGDVNYDANAAAVVRIVADTNQQSGVVNTEVANPLKVVVLDASNRRVGHALVTFTAVQMDADFSGNIQIPGSNLPSYQYQVRTDAQGVASASFVFPKVIAGDTVYMVDAANPSSVATRVGQVTIDVSVQTDDTPVKPIQPFVAYAWPDEAVEIQYESNGALQTADTGVGSIEGYSVIVADAFGNRVSNVNLKFRAAQPNAYNINILTPLTLMGQQQLEQCRANGISRVFVRECSIAEFEESSTPFGRRVTPFPGEAEFTDGSSGAINFGLVIKAFVPGNPRAIDEVTLQYPSQEPATGVVFRSVTRTSAGRGLQSAAYVGTKINELETIRAEWNPARYETQPTFTFTAIPNAQTSSYPQSIVNDEGVTVPSSPAHILTETPRLAAPGVIESDFEMLVGTAPFINLVQVDATYKELGSEIEETTSGSAFVGYGVKLKVDPIPLQGLPVENTQISFSYDAPSAYTPATGGILIKAKDTEQGPGAAIYYGEVEIDYANKRGVLSVPRGVLNEGKQYTAYAYLNYGDTTTQIESKPLNIYFDIPLIPYLSATNDIFAEPTDPSLIYSGGTVKGTAIVDLANQTVCYGAARLSFALTADSNVKLEFFYGDGSGGSKTIINSEDYESGLHVVDIPISELPPGEYTYVITAERSSGYIKTEERTGKAYIRYTYSDSLPIGHANYQNIDLFDGHLTLSATDLSAAGRGLPISFSRSYSSSNTKLGLMGVGWGHSYESKIVRTGCGGTVIIGGDGGGQTFTSPSIAGPYTPQKGYHGSLEKTPDGYDFYSKNGTRYHYTQYNFTRGKGADREYYLEYIIDTNGNVTSLSYDNTDSKHAKITTVQTNTQTLSFQYETINSVDGRGPVVKRLELTDTSSTAGFGAALAPVATVDFEYDDFGRLTASTYTGLPSKDLPGGVNIASGLADAGAPLNSRTLRYEYKIPDETLYYDPNGSIYENAFHERAVISKVIDALGNPVEYQSTVHEVFVASSLLSDAATVPAYTQVTNPDTAPIIFDYGSRAQRVDGLTTSVTDGRNNVTYYTLNSYGAATSIRSPAGEKNFVWDTQTDILLRSVTNENRYTTEYDYDEHGNKLKETIIGVSSQEFTYYPVGPKRIKNLMRTHVNSRRNTTSYTYDLNGNLTNIHYPLNNTVSARLDTSPKHAYEGFTYNTLGDRLTSTDSNGNVTRMTYDAYGQIATVTNAEGQTSYYRWNLLGQKILEVDARGSDVRDSRFQTAYQYNGINQLTHTIYPEIDGNRAVKYFEYDANGNLLRRVDENGQSTEWTYDDSSRVASETNALEITKNYYYDVVGNLERETDFNGGVTIYRYDGANRQTDILGPEDREIHRDYDGVGNITFEYVTIDRKTEYRYDAYNNRVYVKDPLKNETTSLYDGEGNLLWLTDARGGETHTTRFVYDERNRLVTKTEPLGRITSYAYDPAGNKILQKDGNGGITQMHYDALNRLEWVKDAEQYANQNAIISSYPTTYTYDVAGNRLTELNRRGYLTEHTFDARNRLTSTTSKGDVDGNEQNIHAYFYYDGVGNLTEKHLPNGDTIVSHYDALNRVEWIEDTLGEQVRYGYDNNGNVLSKTVGLTDVTTYVYDALNRLEETYIAGNKVETLTYDIYSNIATREDAKGNVVTYLYDANNRLEKQYNPVPFDDEFIEIGYDAVGNKTSETDARGNTIDYIYDALNRIIETRYPYFSAVTGEQLTVVTGYDFNNNVTRIVDRKGIETLHRYDLNNRLKTTHVAGLQIIENEYDAEGNVILSTDAEHNTTSYNYDARNLLTREARLLAAISLFEYDAVGNKTLARSPEGVEATWYYDVRNRLEWQEVPNSNGSGRARTEFTYHDNGKLHTKTTPENQATWVYTYFPGSALLKDITDPDQEVTSYIYDANFNLETHTDAADNVTTYYYDELNRRTQIEQPGYAVTTFDLFDANGNVLETTSANGVLTTLTYDTLNRVTTRSFANYSEGPAAQVTLVESEYDDNDNLLRAEETYNDGSANRVYQWQYDDFGRNTVYIDGYGKQLLYSYDNNGNRLTLTDADNKVSVYTYDDLNRVATVYNSGGLTQYSYYRDSQLKRVTYPNSISAHYTYNASGRVASIENRQNNAIVSRYTYEYDSNGNREKQYEINGGTEELTTYAFDDLDRLTGVVYDVGGEKQVSVVYGYDEVYNRISETHTNTAGEVIKDRKYNHNVRNQIESIDDLVDASQSVAYTYDDNGNQLTKTVNGDISQYIWDNRNHLRTVMQGGSTVGQFLYDPQGLRIQKLGDRGTERYTYDDQSVLLQTDENGNTLAKYDYGPDRLLSLTHQTEGTQYYLTDALRSVVNLAKRDGTIQARYQYDAFGNKRAEAGSSWNRFSFTGYEEDSESGLLYAKARFYDPDTGRFLSSDPWEGDNTLPPSLHKYLYGYQNPVVWIDPDGRNAISPFSAGQAEQRTRELRESDPEAANKAAKQGAVLFTGIITAGATIPAGIACYASSACSWLTLAAATSYSLSDPEPADLIPASKVAKVADKATAALAKQANKADAAATPKINAESGTSPVSGIGAKVEGPNGGVAVNTGKTNDRGEIVYRRDSNGSYYSIDSVSGKQKIERSPFESDSQVNKNQIDGARREKETEKELQLQYPNASVQREQYLRDVDGKIVTDPITGEARRIDHIVVQDGKVVDSVETTSLTARKKLQEGKEARIRKEGGDYIQDRDTGCVLPACETRTVRRE